MEPPTPTPDRADTDGIDGTDAPELDALGWSDRWRAHWAAVDEPAAVPARVVRRDRDTVLVAGPEGTRRLPLLGRDAAVGDWVAALPDRLHSVLPRHGAIRRVDPSGGEQVLAANVDVVLVVCGLDRPVKAGRIQRSAVQAWDAGATPLVVLTKCDVIDPHEAERLAGEAAAAAPTADVVVVSALTGDGIAELRAAIGGRTSLLLGESGAGKSTLVNALAGTERAATGAVRGGDAKGRHTTTHRQLHRLPAGVILVDVPGLRALGVLADDEAVDATFPAIEALAPDCRFRDCAHEGEPGCAVEAAATDGRLDPDVLAAYHRLRREARSESLRAVEHERRRAERVFARVAKDAQRRKGKPPQRR